MIKSPEADQIELSKLRALRNISQKELSKELNFSNGLIALYENGYRKPSLTNAIAIANFFKMPVEKISFCNFDKMRV